MSDPSIRAPPGTILASLKGIAIAASLVTAGELTTAYTLLPSLYPAAQTSHRLAAQQFAHQYRTLAATLPPADLLTTLMCSGLAFVGYTQNKSALGWKLWASAAAVTLSAMPWGWAFMEKPARKLLWVSEVAESATITQSSPTPGIPIMVTEHTNGASVGPSASFGAGSTLGLPPSGKGSGPRGGGITPMEEFEPFEDAVMDEQEYEQLKVIKLLKQWNSYMAVRMLLPWTAGTLALWATLGE